MDVVTFIAQGAPSGQSCASAMMFPMMIVMIFYFLVWRPQQKQISESKRFRDGLKDGDKVITAGGLYGRVVRVDADVIELELAPKTKVRVDRSQIVKLQSSEDDGETS